MNLRPLLLAALVLQSSGDGPADNVVDNVRTIPPPGIAVPHAEKERLSNGLAKLEQAIEQARQTRDKLATNFLPDLLIFRNAVHYALKYDEFLDTNQLTSADKLLQDGLKRAQQLAEGLTPWHSATGLVVRGYKSRIDHSIQPYGLVVPASYAADAITPRRLDIWFHGRDEKLTEIKFLTDRQRSYGEFLPENAFVLHLYGRYCNANKFAGEVDLFEALAEVKRNYRIDENRILVRGFSMGGAACWQFAVHYPGQWAGAAPGAGFSETPEFLKVFQNEPINPPWWEQKLWRMYDCTDYAINLFNCPTVAYSGESDKQKQAADIMARALRQEGIELTHIIGPNTAHKYEPGAKEEINRRMDSIATTGRNPFPREIKFSTWTLRYNECHWLEVEGLAEHWERARVDASIKGNGTIEVTTRNVTQLRFDFPAGACPLDMTRAPEVILDGKKILAPPVMSDRSWKVRFYLERGRWRVAQDLPPGLRKSPGLQGPIDDAFMDSFVFVLPSRKARNERVQKWVEQEQARAIEHWRKQFRGEARVIKDSELTDDLVKDAHLVLWGDAESNQVIQRILPQLPIMWEAAQVRVGEASFAASTHVPVLIYPNPLNPSRYVVFNSGFTFREYDYLNNARQISKLPDFAILDISVPPNARYAGRVVHAGFFNEQWQVKKSENRRK